MVKIYVNDNLVFENVKIAKSFKDKLLGIMFLDEIKDFDAILFEGVNWIHSFFCKIKFNAIYLDEEYRVIKIEKEIEPNRLLEPVFEARYVIEYFDKRKIFVKDEVKVEE